MLNLSCLLTCYVKKLSDRLTSQATRTSKLVLGRRYAAPVLSTLGSNIHRGHSMGETNFVVVLRNQKVLGIVCILFFTGCGIGAFMAKQYNPIFGFIIFAMLGVYLVASSGRLELNSEFISHDNSLGTYRIKWAEVCKVEIGNGGTIVLHGENKRFVVPPFSLWAGEKKLAAYGFLIEKMKSVDGGFIQSPWGDYKIHKNVKKQLA
jgi:hypothetical protein